MILQQPHTIRLPFDAISNIITFLFTNTPSAFDVFLAVSALYKLRAYLLTAGRRFSRLAAQTTLCVAWPLPGF